MSRLQILVLGLPEARRDDQRIKLPTRKAVALLVYLAVQGTEQSREHLGNLLWPDLDPPRGRAALRNTLTYLREPLGTERLITDRDTVRLQLLPDDDLDLDTLRRADSVARGVTSARPAERITILQTATTGYRGAFLEGFSIDDAPAFAEWADLWREDARQRAGEVFDRLSALHLAAGDATTTLNLATRWVAHDPVNEAAYRTLMRARLAAGDRAGALVAYAACRQALAANLDVAPAPETEALAARARLADSPADRPPRSRNQAEPPVDAPGPSKSLDAPFVGREDQFGTLVEAFHRARRGQTEVVVLEGEAGIGKTRLASEFVNWARAQGTDLLIGRAFETGGQLPYQALVDAFGRRLDDENAPDDLIANVWLAELSRLLPDLRERYPDLEASAVDDNAGPARLFEAVARLCEALARRSPLVLLVDDLQWADRASFDLLRHIARRGTERHAPIVLLLTLRTESLATSADLVEWLAALSRDHPIARVALRSLSVDDLRKMLARLGVDGDIASLASRLHAETKGQPFFTVESLRALVERGVLVARNDRDGRRVFSYASTAGEPFGPSAFLPATVRQMITGRLARLSRPAADLLVASAILGQHGTFTPLCAVAGLSEEQALPALDETMGRQLLGESRVRATATAPVVYLHTHDKIREVVYTDAGDARRRVFHRRAVEALRRIGAPAAELAHHARAAGLVDEAIAFSVEAGEDSLRLYALRDAIDHFQLARETLADYPPATAAPTVPVAPRTELTSRLFLQMGRAYELQSERDSARAAYESLLGHARASRQPSIEVTALNRLATLTAQNGTDFDRATALLEAGRAIAEASEDRLGLVETEWNLAQMGIYTSNPPMALRHGERALELARAEGAPELIARSLNALAYAYRNLGRWEDSAAVAGEAAKHFAELGNAALEIDSLGLFASSQVRYGALRDGIHAGRRALALSREIENPWGQVASAYHLVPGLLDAGQYGEARDVARQGTDTARVQATRPMLIFSLVELGAVQRALLSLDDAREIHQEALTLSHGLPGLFQDMAAAALCADEALAGRWEPAYEAARLAIAGRNGTIHQTGLTRWLECEALVRGGDRAAAERDTALFGEHIGANRRVRIPYLRCLAVLARAGGNFVEAVGYLDEAAALARSIGLPGEAWSIDVALADAYRALGNPARAINALGHAASTIESLAESLDAATRTMFLAAAIPR